MIRNVFTRKQVFKTFAKLQIIVVLSKAKNLNELEFCYVTILHFIQEDKTQCFAKIYHYESTRGAQYL